MKKIIGVSLAFILTLGATAQNEQIQNKNGVDVMPVSGEWALGMNAIPVFTYVGNLMGYTNSNTNLQGNKFVNYWAGNTIFGKYMLSDDNAVRAHLRIGEFVNQFDNYVFDDVADSPDSLVMDQYKFSSSIWNLGVGYEFRRGKTRLRGIYGGELLFSYQTGINREYSYGNAMGNGNPAPESTTWFNFGGVSGEGALGQRIVSEKGGNFTGLGARGFIGVEYFIAPKICFGTEFGWSVNVGKTSETVQTIEWWDPTANTTGAVRYEEIETAGSRNLSIDTDNFGGSLYFMFYF